MKPVGQNTNRPHGWYVVDGREVFGPLPKAARVKLVKPVEEPKPEPNRNARGFRRDIHFAPIDPWRNA